MFPAYRSAQKRAFTIISGRSPMLPLPILALAVASFGIGTTEFVIMGLLPQVGADLGVSLSSAGLLVTGYALGVTLGAPPVAILTANLPRKTLLLSLMVIFTLGNLACALAPGYGTLMAARVLTSLAHGAFFGVGSVVATSLVRADKQASAIALMFTGSVVATLPLLILFFVLGRQLIGRIMEGAIK